MLGRTLRWLRAEVGFTLVLLVLAVALLYLVYQPGRWGRSSGGVSTALLLAGLLRGFLPSRRAGLLAVRSRVFDTVAYLLLGAAILTIDIRLHA